MTTVKKMTREQAAELLKKKLREAVSRSGGVHLSWSTVRNIINALEGRPSKKDIKNRNF